MFQRLCGLSHHIKGLGEVHSRCRMKDVRDTTWAELHGASMWSHRTWENLRPATWADGLPSVAPPQRTARNSAATNLREQPEHRNQQNHDFLVAFKLKHIKFTYSKYFKIIWTYQWTSIKYWSSWSESIFTSIFLLFIEVVVGIVGIHPHCLDDLSCSNANFAQRLKRFLNLSWFHWESAHSTNLLPSSNLTDI